MKQNITARFIALLCILSLVSTQVWQNNMPKIYSNISPTSLMAKEPFALESIDSSSPPWNAGKVGLSFLCFLFILFGTSFVNFADASPKKEDKKEIKKKGLFLDATYNDRKKMFEIGYGDKEEPFYLFARGGLLDGSSGSVFLESPFAVAGLKSSLGAGFSAEVLFSYFNLRGGRVPLSIFHTDVGTYGDYSLLTDSSMTRIEANYFRLQGYVEGVHAFALDAQANWIWVAGAGIQIDLFESPTGRAPIPIINSCLLRHYFSNHHWIDFLLDQRFETYGDPYAARLYFDKLNIFLRDFTVSLFYEGNFNENIRSSVGLSYGYWPEKHLFQVEGGISFFDLGLEINLKYRLEESRHVLLQDRQQLELRLQYGFKISRGTDVKVVASWGYGWGPISESGWRAYAGVEVNFGVPVSEETEIQTHLRYGYEDGLDRSIKGPLNKMIKQVSISSFHPLSDYQTAFFRNKIVLASNRDPDLFFNNVKNFVQTTRDLMRFLTYLGNRFNDFHYDHPSVTGRNGGFFEHSTPADQRQNWNKALNYLSDSMIDGMQRPFLHSRSYEPLLMELVKKINLPGVQGFIGSVLEPTNGWAHGINIIALPDGILVIDWNDGIMTKVKDVRDLFRIYQHLQKFPGLYHLIADWNGRYQFRIDSEEYQKIDEVGGILEGKTINERIHQSMKNAASLKRKLKRAQKTKRSFLDRSENQQGIQKLAPQFKWLNSPAHLLIGTSS